LIFYLHYFITSLQWFIHFFIFIILKLDFFLYIFCFQFSLNVYCTVTRKLHIMCKYMWNICVYNILSSDPWICQVCALSINHLLWIYVSVLLRNYDTRKMTRYYDISHDNSNLVHEMRELNRFKSTAAVPWCNNKLQRRSRRDTVKGLRVM